ncbi:MAG: hypothetical protein LQ349_002248 [Xanthoria aureola]|nr:MAG: hypothetical protein LQ349_002248 [Xanthoria aureola]
MPRTSRGSGEQGQGAYNDEQGAGPTNSKGRKMEKPTERAIEQQWRCEPYNPRSNRLLVAESKLCLQLVLFWLENGAADESDEGFSPASSALT